MSGCSSELRSYSSDFHNNQSCVQFSRKLESRARAAAGAHWLMSIQSVQEIQLSKNSTRLNINSRTQAQVARGQSWKWCSSFLKSKIYITVLLSLRWEEKKRQQRGSIAQSEAKWDLEINVHCLLLNQQDPNFSLHQKLLTAFKHLLGNGRAIFFPISANGQTPK